MSVACRCLGMYTWCSYVWSNRSAAGMNKDYAVNQWEVDNLFSREILKAICRQFYLCCKKWRGLNSILEVFKVVLTDGCAIVLFSALTWNFIEEIKSNYLQMIKSD